ncbi:MAG: hypothetical protein ACRDBG_13980 [Waterburya sp.]
MSVEFIKGIVPVEVKDGDTTVVKTVVTYQVVNPVKGGLLAIQFRPKGWVNPNSAKPEPSERDYIVQFYDIIIKDVQLVTVPGKPLVRKGKNLNSGKEGEDFVAYQIPHTIEREYTVADYDPTSISSIMLECDKRSWNTIGENV